MNIQIQWARLCDIVAYAVEHVPFYQRHFANEHIRLDPQKPLRGWNLPFLTKEDVQKYPDQLISCEMQRDGLIAEYTSGSTGTPLCCYKTIDERVKGAFPLWKRRHVWNRHIYQARVANFWNLSGKIAELEDDRTLSLSPFHLHRTTFPEYLAHLAHFQPEWLTGTPSTLSALAHLIRSSHQSVPRLPLTHIELTSEYVHEHQRKLIAEVFGVPVVEQYGCREVWTIAYECLHGHMHVVEENVYVEVIKDERPALPGEEGELVVTGLNFRAMPFIRYRLGDLVTMEQADSTCNASGPVITLSGGRVGTMIDLGSRMVNSSLLLRAITGSLIKSTFLPPQQLQLVHTSNHDFTVNVVTSQESTGGIEKRIEETMRDYLGDEVAISFHYMEYIPPDPSGKTPEFISKL